MNTRRPPPTACILAVALAWGLRGGAPAAAGEPLALSLRAAPNDTVFLLEGKDIDDASVNLTVLGISRCDCRLACLEHDWCLAVAVSDDGGEKLQCRLSDRVPEAHRLVDMNNTTFIYWEASLPSFDVRGREADSLFYIEAKELQDIVAAREMCQSVPGFRLGVYKTETQLQLLVDMAKEASVGMFTDLRRTIGLWRYGDDFTPANRTLISAVLSLNSLFDGLNDGFVAAFMSQDGYYGINDTGENMRVICQANP
ncbi:uncharacterized protein LOC119576549 [Penaeus monodon]|uniref:uncharacterized protein LOC119576549 n=1 Tax=Penaeus monodon TaxID=6687 RepID=UPI0018A6E95B|nr:uncharacterized protein LOC119576549 [Penaeus monodon]